MDVRFDYDKYSIYLRGIENLYRILMNYYENIEDMQNDKIYYCT